MTLRQRSAGVSASVVRMWRAEAARLRWSSGTILGREVVPEVCSTRASSSSSRRSGLDRRRRRAPSAASSNQPAGRSGDVVSRSTSAPCRRADLDRRPLVAVGHDQRLGAQVGQVEVELLGPVGRVQGRRGGAAGDGDERRRHLRPVRQHDRHPIAAADARARSASPRSHRRARAGRRSSASAARVPGSRRHRRDAAGGGPGRSRPWRTRLLLGEDSDVAGT